MLRLAGAAAVAGAAAAVGASAGPVAASDDATVTIGNAHAGIRTTRFSYGAGGSLPTAADSGKVVLLEIDNETGQAHGAIGLQVKGAETAVVALGRTGVSAAGTGGPGVNGKSQDAQGVRGGE